MQVIPAGSDTVIDHVPVLSLAQSSIICVGLDRPIPWRVSPYLAAKPDCTTSCGWHGSVCAPDAVAAKQKAAAMMLRRFTGNSWEGAIASGAQTLPCHPHDVVQAGLAAKYGETRHAIGLASPTQIMEIWASDETGTWSITVTDPAGMTCMIGQGQGYEAMDEELPAAGAPT